MISHPVEAQTPGSELFAQKLGELRAKAASIEAELDSWTEVSERGETLEKFNTRIRAIRKALDQAIDPLTLVLARDHGPRILDLAADLELSILEIYRVWEFFRAKLAMRYVPWLGRYLLAADELAWRCYAPMIPYMEGPGREPPLVFLSSASSPFTMPRGSAYEAEDVPGEAISSADLAALLRSLPIPVVGVPWFQLRHLPDALVIAHEIGHDVEQDVGLGAGLDVAIRGAIADDARREAWLCWRGEVFADAFGVLTTGPAFVGALIDFVAGPPRFIATERPSRAAWGLYPTRALRVMLAVAVLREYGFPAEATGLEERWQSVYPRHASEGFVDDIPRVAHSMLATRLDALDESSLGELGLFTPAMHKRAVDSARDALGRTAPRADDAPTLIAAARIAYETGDARYEEHDVASRILRKIACTQQVGVRGSGTEAPPQSARDARDKRIGSALATAITSAHGLSPDFQPRQGETDVQAQEPD